MQRYKFTVDGISKAIQFLKGKSEEGPAWAKRFKAELKVKGTDVYYGELKIIAQEQVDDYLRTEMFKKDGTLPFGRDAAFHKLKKTVLGVPRRRLMKFIKSQDIFEQTKAAVPKAKAKGGKKVKTYTVETDLVFIRKNDLVNSNKRFEKSVKKVETYMVSTLVKTTGLSRLSYVKSKDSSVVTPIVIKHIRSIAKALKVHPRTMAYLSDSGTEFRMSEIKKVVPDAKNVPLGSSVEKKNQDAQRVFYRILKARRSVDIADALSQTEKLLNETFNRVHGASPNELVEKSKKEFNIKNYNNSRGEYIAGDNRKPFEVGQRVRVQIKKEKGADIGYKTYKGLTFSKRVYIVKKIQDAKHSPRKYWVRGKWWTQDKLLATEAEDEKTKEMVVKRDKEQADKDKEADEKAAVLAEAQEKKRLAEKAKKEEAGIIPRTRSTRLKDRLRKQREVGERLDQQLVRIEDERREAARRRGVSVKERRRKVVVRGRKYEREGEEEWVPGQEKKKKRKKRVKRV